VERLSSIISEIWEGGVGLVCLNKNDIIYIYEGYDYEKFGYNMHLRPFAACLWIG
jgi:hypothetical protein